MASPIEAPAGAETRHIAFFDGLRGIAVLLVVAYHMHEHGLMPDPFPALGLTVYVPWVFLGGNLGVEIFFFLSGLVLFYPYARHLIEGRPQPTIKHFYLRRSLKIVPSYVVVLLANAVIAPQDVPAHESITQHVLLHLFFLHGFFPNAFASVVGPLWSLAVEVEFYLLFPLLALIWLRNVWVGAALMFAISITYRIYLSRTALDGWFWNASQLPAFFELFAAGMLVAYLFVLARRRAWWFTTRPWVSAAISGLALAAFYVLFRDMVAQGGGPRVWIWQNSHRDLVTVLLAIAALTGPFAARPFRLLIANPVTAYLAVISYNLYLWNKPLVIMFTNTIWNRGGWNAGTAWGIVAFAALSVGVAWFFTYFLEQPFLQRGWSLLPAVATAQHFIVRARERQAEFVAASSGVAAPRSSAESVADRAPAAASRRDT